MKKIISFILILAMSATFSSCRNSKGDGSGQVFRMNLTSNPSNLDPQLATDESSLAVISNMFATLIRINANGEIEPDAAENYSVSADGLTYTFKIKENIRWMSLGGFDAPLTAYDFEYAFERILNEEYSPHAKLFEMVEDTQATDNYTFVITLKEPYFRFIETLTYPAASPCNMEFFENAKGRYGLIKEATVACGNFYLKDWNYDPYWNENFIILSRHTKNNTEENRIFPSGVHYAITKGESDDKADFLDDKSDVFVLDNYDKKLLSNNGYIEKVSKSYGLLFNLNNSDNEYFLNADARFALAVSIRRDNFASLPENLKPANGIIPEAVRVMGRSYRELVSDAAMTDYQPTLAKEKWDAYLAYNDLLSLDNVKILVPENFNGDLSVVTRQWQEKLGFLCGLEVVSQNEYYLKMSSGEYAIALVELNGDFDVPYSFFANELFGDITKTELINSMKTAPSLSSAIEIYNQAETLIARSCEYVPLFYGCEYLVFTDGIEGLSYNPFAKTVYFGDGKNY